MGIVVLWLRSPWQARSPRASFADRWFQQFSIPGYSAYEANQRTLDTFGTGRKYPMVLVFSVGDGDIRALAGLRDVPPAER